MELDALEAVLCFRGAFSGHFHPGRWSCPSAKPFFLLYVSSLLKQGEKNIKIEAHEVEICFDFKQRQTRRTPQPPEKH